MKRYKIIKYIKARDLPQAIKMEAKASIEYIGITEADDEEEEEDEEIDTNVYGFRRK